MSTQKALELLGLPQEAAAFDGRITTRTTRSLVIVDRYDFTINQQGFVRSAYVEWQENNKRVTSVADLNDGQTTGDDLFGAYCLNWMANQIYSFGYDIFSISPERLTLVNGDKEVVFSREGNKIFIDSIFEIDPSGNPLTVPVQVVTESITWVNQVGVPPQTQKKVWRSRKKYVNYTWEKVQELTGLSKEDIIYNTRTTYNGEVADPNVYVTSIAADIQIIGESYEGIVYINGRDARTFDYRKLITSFNKTCPAYIPEWRLYNAPPVGFTISGATVVINAALYNPVDVVSGNADIFDIEDNSLTFNEPLAERATLIFYYAFGTTGKNENWGRKIDLETGEEASWH
jgi:hypothetical protein